ncbi:MAG: hypothetical protein B7Z08_08460 [Sphingomonadales bacterium 32-68-7]|nr:MAG: hypothetical protein B7Z33_09535 [Sphingomonadales bacterium 12-68-11]OYX08665.1 MAG: hypothetical protein B7Z08_08460 [Sphingomonadales bacterium 32-68-7]
MDDLLAEFVAETRDMLAALAGEVVAWEADPTDRARLDTIFRFVHTVKGNCGFFDFPRLEALSHAAEDALADVREGTRPADAALVTVVLAVLDRIAAMIERIERAEPLGDDTDEDLIAALRSSAETTAAAAQPTAAGAALAEQRTIRLPVELIDRVMSGVSEMVLARNDMARRLQGFDGLTGLEAPFARLSGLLGEVREAITRTRMRRIDGLFGTFPRMVRDLSAELGKQVQLEVESGDVELDREMIELIRDPLLHIVRNAIDHGIEPPAARESAGKAPVGRLSIAARQSGNTIRIGIADDGRGIDCARLADKAAAAGLIAPAEAAALTREQAIELIFAAGLSTAETVTAISGRGVGMDVVRANVEKIGGTLEVESEPGEGTRFLINVPLTLSILPCLTVRSGGQVFAVPRSYIEEIVGTAGGQAEFAHVGERRLLTFRDRRLPCVPLSAALGLAPRGEAQTFVIVRLGWGDLYALEVEDVLDHHELVVKPLSPAIMASGLFVGCTQLDDGQPALLLDVAAVGYASGIPRELHRPAIPAKGADVALDHGLQVMLLTGLDGARRAIPLDLVEQIERAPIAAVRRRGPFAQVVLGDRILPLAGLGEGDELSDPQPLVRLRGETGPVAYAVRAVIDIEHLAETPRRVGADPARLALIGEDAVELIDEAALRRELEGCAA